MEPTSTSNNNNNPSAPSSSSSGGGEGIERGPVEHAVTVTEYVNT